MDSIWEKLGLKDLLTNDIQLNKFINGLNLFGDRMKRNKTMELFSEISLR